MLYTYSVDATKNRVILLKETNDTTSEKGDSVTREVIRLNIFFPLHKLALHPKHSAFSKVTKEALQCGLTALRYRIQDCKDIMLIVNSRLSKIRLLHDLKYCPLHVCLSLAYLHPI